MSKQAEMINLSETLILHLEQTAKVLKLSGMRFFERNNFDITYNDFIIIDALYTHPHIHQRNLAKLLLKGTANLSRDLEKLESRGFITRSIESKDNRIVKSLVLTSQGEAIYAKIASVVKEHLTFIEHIFSDDERAIFEEYLLRLKEKVVEIEGVVIE